MFMARHAKEKKKKKKRKKTAKKPKKKKKTRGGLLNSNRNPGLKEAGDGASAMSSGGQGENYGTHR